MPFAATADVERYDEAANWFLARKVVTPEQYAALAAGSYQHAFWVGGGLQLDQIQRVFDKTATAIETGEAFADWRDRVRSELRNDAHAETVFRNAVQRAYNAGRWQQMRQPDVLRFRPFWMFDAILDDHTTTICKICDGTILDAEDPWWDTHICPLHHRCRSSIRNLRRSEAEKRGITKQAPDVDEHRPPGEWGAAPNAATPWKPEPGRYDGKLDKELKRKSKRLPPPTKPLVPGAKAKPPPPAAVPAPEHFIDRATARRLQKALEGDGKAFREWLRAALGTHAGATFDRTNAGIVVNPAWLPRNTAAALVLNETGSLLGLAGVHRAKYEDLKAGLKELAAGKAIDNVPGKMGTLADGLKTMLHEEIHAAGKSSIDGLGDRTPWNRFVEEVSTELVAQRVATKVGAFREPLRFGVTGFNRPPSYQVEISTMLHDVVTATGWDVDDALERITDAGERMRGPIPSKRDYIDDFLDGLDAEPDAKRKLRAQLRTRRVRS